jgi:hypothetical protein
MKDYVVYTAVFGNYAQRLYDIPRDNTDVDFVCITDNADLIANGWRIIFINEPEENPIYLNRKFKILNHIYFSNYRWSLYVDANIEIIGNPVRLFLKYISKDENLFIPLHNKRKCIYAEAIECISLGRGNTVEILKQIRDYKLNGMPPNYGLTENGILLRNNNEPVLNNIMNEWWNEFIKYKSFRDQLSLPYILWKTSCKINPLDETARNNNPFFRYHFHSDIPQFSGFEKILFGLKKIVRKACATIFVRLL